MAAYRGPESDRGGLQLRSTSRQAQSLRDGASVGTLRCGPMTGQNTVAGGTRLMIH